MVVLSRKLSKLDKMKEMIAKLFKNLLNTHSKDSKEVRAFLSALEILSTLKSGKFFDKIKGALRSRGVNVLKFLNELKESLGKHS